MREKKESRCEVRVGIGRQMKRRARRDKRQKTKENQNIDSKDFFEILRKKICRRGVLTKKSSRNQYLEGILY